MCPWKPSIIPDSHTVLVFIKQALAFQDLMTNLNVAIVRNYENFDVDLSDFVVSDSESLDSISEEKHDLETELPYLKPSSTEEFDTTQDNENRELQHPNIDTDSLPLGQVKAPFITKRNEACPETEGMVDNKHRDNTEVCSNPQLESTLVESKINSEPICKLFALFRRANVDAKSILHRGRLFKRSVNGKTEPISIPPY